MQSTMPVHYATYSRLLGILLRLIDAWLAMWPRRLRPVPGPGTPDPARILVCNQGHLGDAILGTAVIPVLRRRFPHAEIGVLLHPASRVVVAGHPAVRWVHTVTHWHLNRGDRSLWHRLLRHHRSTRAAEADIRSLAYDLAIDLHPYFPNSIPLLARCNIRRLIGWDSGGFGALLDEVVHNESSAMPMLARHATVLRVAGADVEAADMRPDLTLTDEARRAWARFAEANQVPADFVALHVGAHAPHRRWPVERWAEVVTALHAGGHGAVLLGHGPAEVALCAAITRLGGQAAVDLSGRLGWGELLAAIADCRLLVSHDSAATHLAAAFDTPRICIATGIHDLRVWLSRSARSVVLMNPVPCAPCGRTAGCDTMACIRGVTAASVVGAVQALCGAQQAGIAQLCAPRALP